MTSSKLYITAAIPAHNSDAGRLARVLRGLEKQSLGGEIRETILVDNGSEPEISVSDFPVRIVREKRLGLTWARVRAIREARSDVIVFVDDDNLLDSTYLENALRYLDNHPDVSAIGGSIEPEYESEPPDWVKEFSDLLALRDFGPEELISDSSGEYPRFAPVGAGMVIRKPAAVRWLDSLGARDDSLPDRRGGELSSSGDNNMIFSCLKAGEKVAYVPELRLTHLIPKERMTAEYLARLNRSIQKSWIQVLRLHGACPWNLIPGWTVPLRKMRAWFSYRAWRRPVQWIKWQGACGHFEGRAGLG